MKKEKTKKCSLCRAPYEGFGHNAAPYAGRCCTDCNYLLVVPARLVELRNRFGARKEEKGEASNVAS